MILLLFCHHCIYKHFSVSISVFLYIIYMSHYLWYKLCSSILWEYHEAQNILCVVVILKTKEFYSNLSTKENSKFPVRLDESKNFIYLTHSFQSLVYAPDFSSIRGVYQFLVLYSMEVGVWGINLDKIFWSCPTQTVNHMKWKCRWNDYWVKW